MSTLLTIAQLTYESWAPLLWNEASSDPANPRIAWHVGEDIIVSRWGQQVSSKVVYPGITAGKSSHKFQQDYFIKKRGPRSRSSPIYTCSLTKCLVTYCKAVINLHKLQQIATNLKMDRWVVSYEALQGAGLQIWVPAEADQRLWCGNYDYYTSCTESRHTKIPSYLMILQN